MLTLVFDTGPLSHFARIESLDVLKHVVGERRALIPQAVVEELNRGAQLDQRIRAVLEADWIEHRHRLSPPLRPGGLRQVGRRQQPRTWVTQEAPCAGSCARVSRMSAGCRPRKRL